MAVLKLTVAVQQDLIAQYPKAFSLNAWSSQGWTNVHLQFVEIALFRILITEAWEGVGRKTKGGGGKGGGRGISRGGLLLQRRSRTTKNEES